MYYAAIKFCDLHVTVWGCLFLLEGLLHLAYWCQNGRWSKYYMGVRGGGGSGEKKFLRTISRHTVIDILCDIVKEIKSLLVVMASSF